MRGYMSLKDIVLIIIVPIVLLLIFFKNGKFVKLAKVKHRLYQKSSLILLNSITNNFDIENQRVSLKHLKKVMGAIQEDIKIIYKYAKKKGIKQILVNTNEIFIKLFKPEQRKGNISIAVAEEDKCTCIDCDYTNCSNYKTPYCNMKKQPIERLIFVGILTIIKNFKNKEFWDYINKEVHVLKYIITINEIEE